MQKVHQNTDYVGDFKRFAAKNASNQSRSAHLPSNPPYLMHKMHHRCSKSKITDILMHFLHLAV
jgi:hypothetical protein